MLAGQTAGIGLGDSSSSAKNSQSANSTQAYNSAPNNTSATNSESRLNEHNSAKGEASTAAKGAAPGGQAVSSASQQKNTLFPFEPFSGGAKQSPGAS